MNALLIWFLLLAMFYLAFALGLRRRARRGPGGAAAEPPVIPVERFAECDAKLAEIMRVTGHRVQGVALEFSGELKVHPDDAYDYLQEVFGSSGLTPVLLEGPDKGVQVLLLPGSAAGKGPLKPRWVLHTLLFLATFLTTTWAGAQHAGVDILAHPGRFAVGLPYSIGLLAILGAHEFGHYFTARARKITVTPPYFIPMPFSLGTFGAFIQIKSISPHRRALFDVAVAGPLAGLVFAIPALLVGLRWSHALPPNASGDLAQAGVSLDSSVLLACLAKLTHGSVFFSGQRLMLHPLAFAGWLGLLVTALNLLPIGQLDGGHMAHALFGPRSAHVLSIVALAVLFLLALFVWPGLMFWAFIVYFVAGTRDMPTANDVTPVGPGRRALGYFAFVLLLLIILPLPPVLKQAFGAHGPYL